MPRPDAPRVLGQTHPARTEFTSPRAIAPRRTPGENSGPSVYGDRAATFGNGDEVAVNTNREHAAS